MTTTFNSSAVLLAIQNSIQASLNTVAQWGATGLSHVTTVPLDLLSTVALALGLIVLANTVSKAVSRKQSLEAQRFWRLTFRNLAALGFIFGMGIIWRAQLQSVLVALGAAAAGLLIVFKEPMLSLLAFWVRMVKRQYGMGDFLEIDGVRGVVLDITWLHTRLAETGPGQGANYSGRVVEIPNNRMMLAPMFVENLTGEYGAHVIQVPLPAGADILLAERELLSAAEHHCAKYLVEAEHYMNEIRFSRAMDTPSVNPKSRIRFNEDGRVELILRIVVPFREKSKIEQQILHEFLKNADEDAWPRKTLHRRN